MKICEHKMTCLRYVGGVFHIIPCQHFELLTLQTLQLLREMSIIPKIATCEKVCNLNLWLYSSACCHAYMVSKMKIREHKMTCRKAATSIPRVYISNCFQKRRVSLQTLQLLHAHGMPVISKIANLSQGLNLWLYTSACCHADMLLKMKICVVFVL